MGASHLGLTLCILTRWFLRGIPRQFLFLLSLSLLSRADAHSFRKVVVFGDSWLLERTVEGFFRSAWSYVLADRLRIPIDPPFATFGTTSAELRRLVDPDNAASSAYHSRAKDSSSYGPNDLVLIHVGGNDAQPAIIAVWFAWWSDASQRATIRGYMREVVDNTAALVSTLCGNPFRSFVVSEPPFSRYLPIIKTMVTTNSLRRLKEETSQMYAETFGSVSWAKRGCSVIVFPEGLHLDDLGDHEGLTTYVDSLHPDGNIHRRLGELLHAQLTGGGGNEGESVTRQAQAEGEL